ncbi:TonB-dependent receptor [Rhodobacter sp. SGA-6-6]|uniref:TonB-dependent receptor family protein n=1 Tax=Rhodobacter sp. SGA-6-6 TaxID=2710882 RepID=UPI0013EDF25E|nr:TonB-dependent receptor [Rhodobacter sp. SGA-6-6]NGM45821.1 TonB-dependent receptor [Rhodobacter sp. SGA-6-6]
MPASRLSRPALAMLLAGTVLSAAPVLAQSVSPGATIDLGTIWLEADNPVKLRFGVTPGGVTLIDRSAAKDTEVAPRLTDALRLNPGIVLQEFFGGNDQPRIQIRGSGQQQNPAERGLLVMIDGMPVNRADGAYVVGIASPGGAETIEVFRGAAANRLGAAVMGGALNFTSPSGASQPGWRGALGAGSFGRRDLALSYGIDGETADSWFHLEHSESDGFRDYNSSDRTVVGGNVTFAMGEATTRLFFTHTDLSFDVAGPLTWAALQDDPTQVHRGPVMVGGVPTNPGPNVVRDKPHRETVQTLAGLRTTWEGAGGLFDVGLSVGRTDDSFAFPVSAGFRDTEGTDGTLTARYTIPGAGDLPLFEAGFSWSLGEADRDYFHNIGGTRGAAFGSNKLKSETLSIHAGGNVEIGGFTLSPALAFIHASRRNTDLWTGATRPTIAFGPGGPTPGTAPAVSTSYDRDYSGFAPSLALSWKPAEGQFAWVSLAKSFEPPTHDDLIGTVGGTPNSGPAGAMFATPDLKAQTAVTLEAGWRGEAGALSWDVTAYHSRLKNELLSLRDTSGAALASVNADRTVHSGLELGLGAALSDTLEARVAWTWQDFRFDNDPLRGDNRLAGAPEHVLTLALDWQATEKLALSGTVHWVPGKTPVDNMNTVFNQPYTLVDLGASWSVGENAVIVAEVTNLLDERYASSTLVVDQASPTQAAFIPGEGRAFYLGAKLAF